MLTVGVGARPGADLAALVAEVLDGIADRPDVIATIDRRAAEAAAVAAVYGCRLVTFTAEELAGAASRRSVSHRPVPVPSGEVAVMPSASSNVGLVEAAVGTPSVAEAAALLAAGPGARLLVGKRRNSTATAAVATGPYPEGFHGRSHRDDDSAGPRDGCGPRDGGGPSGGGGPRDGGDPRDGSSPDRGEGVR